MGAINMLTDIALILFPVHVIVTLQMSTGKKVTILTFFGARSLYVLSMPLFFLLFHFHLDSTFKFLSYLDLHELTRLAAAISSPPASKSLGREPSNRPTPRVICGNGH